MTKRLVFLGPPGAGKGTIANRIAAKFNLPHISTGDLLRKEVAAETEVGKKAKGEMLRGELVNDELVTAVLRKRLSQGDAAKGFILDGYPRTMKQVELLENALKEIGEKLDVVLHIDASQKTIIKRLSNRRQCKRCGKLYNLVSLPPKNKGRCDVCQGELFQRKDDEQEAIKKRLQAYGQRTKPIISYYKEKGLLREVDCNGEIEENLLNAEEALKGI